MTALMATEAKPVRLVIQTDDELRDALRLEAARRGVDMSELGDEILREALADSLKMVRQRKESEGKRK